MSKFEAEVEKIGNLGIKNKIKTEMSDSGDYSNSVFEW